MEEDYLKYIKEFEELKYLDNLSFDVLSTEYHQALLRDNEKELNNFTQDHRDLYMKLKFRAFKNSNYFPKSSKSSSPTV